MQKSKFQNQLQAGWQGIIRCPAVWIGALAFVLLFTLISKHQFWSGYDTYFHMNSIYEDAMQIKTGHYSYFISLFGFERSGRIVNSLYGPIFNYICGALLLLCRSWIHFEFVIFLVTLFICGIEMYECAKALRANKFWSILVALFYMISYPVLVIWISNFEFTGLGAAVLLPLVILLGIKMLKRRQIKVIPLAVVMAICLQIHLMTSLIATLVLVPFFICGLVLSDQRLKMIRHGICSVAFAICLSGNIFGAIYDVYSTNHLIPTFPNFHLQTRIGNKTLFFHGHIIQGLGLLYTLLLVAVIIGTFIGYRSNTTLDWCLLLEDLIFLWLSSTYFPWDQLLRICPELASIIQFPIRFMAITFITTLLLIGRLMTKLPVKPQLAVNLSLIIVFIFTLHSSFMTINNLSQTWQSNGVVHYWVRPSRYGGFSRHFNQGSQIRRALQSHNLSNGINVVHKITSDYMPTSASVTLQNYYQNPFNQNYVKIFKDQTRYHKFSREHSLQMVWHSSKKGTVQVPLVKYGRTVATLNNHVIHPRKTLIGTMMVNVRPGLNQMGLRYQPSKIFRLMSFISIISWLSIVAYEIYKKIKLM